MKMFLQKIRCRSLLLLAVALPLVWGGNGQFVQAGELKPEHIPADAKWVLHVDLEQLLDTELVQAVRERRPEIVENVRQWIRQQYGIDPRSDLMSVTMFSKDYEEYTGSMILQAKYDPQKVEQQLRGAEQLETTQWNDMTFYTFKVAKHQAAKKQNKFDQLQSSRTEKPAPVRAQNRSATLQQPGQSLSAGKSEKEGHDHSGGKEMTVVMLDSDTIVFGSSVENIKGVVGLLKGDQASLKGKDSKLISKVADGAIMYGAAIELENITKSNLPMPVLKQHEMITWVFGERDGQLFEEATLVGQSEDVAEKMEQLIRGVVAYEQLWAADSEPLTKIVEAAKISRDGDKVKVEWEASTDTVVAGLDDLMARFDDWRLLSAR